MISVKEGWPGDREVIGQVEVTTGNSSNEVHQIIHVAIPNMGDFEENSALLGKSTYSIAALSCGISIEDFRKIPVDKGMQIMKMASKVGSLLKYQEQI